MNGLQIDKSCGFAFGQNISSSAHVVFPVLPFCNKPILETPGLLALSDTPGLPRAVPRAQAGRFVTRLVRGLLHRVSRCRRTALPSA